MNNRNKLKNIEQANLMMEQSYLKSKGLIKESKPINESILALAGGILVGGAILNGVYKWGKNKILQKNILPTGELKKIKGDKGDEVAVLKKYQDKRSGDVYWGVEYMDYTTADPGHREHSIMLWKDDPKKIEEIIKYFEKGGSFSRPTGEEGTNAHHQDYFGPFKSDVKINLPNF